MAIGRTISGLILLGGALLQLGSCTQVQYYHRDISSHEPLARLKLSMPANSAKKADTSYVVAFVSPHLSAETAQTLRSETSSYSNMIAMGGTPVFGVGYAGPSASAVTVYRRADLAKSDYFDGVTKYLLDDMGAMLLGKNIRVLGTFKSRDEMTFDEKKRAIYAFSPTIDLHSEMLIRNTSLSPYVEDGQIRLTGTIEMVLQESITGEKVWIKRIEAPEVIKPYHFVAKYKEPVHPEVGLGLGNMSMPLAMPGTTQSEFDDTDHVLASAISEFYAALGESLSRQIDPEEWSKYLSQAQALRNQKTY